MAERWQSGDRAKCVNVRDIRLPLRTIVAQGGRYLTLGAVYDVRAVVVGHYGQLQLDVGAEYGPKLAQRFVKVAPDEADALASVEKRVEVLA